MGIIGSELCPERGDACILVEAEALADHVVGADEIGPQSDLDRNAPAGGVLVAGQPQLLHRPHVVLEPLPGERVVVVVRGGRAHGAEGEGVARGVTPSRFVDVVGEFDADGDGEVEIGDVPPGSGRPGADGIEEHVGRLREEGVADPAVRQLAGETQIGRSERGDVDRQVGRRQQRADAPALTSGQGKGVHLALVGEPLSRADHAEDLDGLAGPPYRAVVVDAMPALHHLRAARTDPEHEPAG